MHTITITLNEKEEAMNLKLNKEDYVKGFGGRNWRNYVIIFETQIVLT